MYKILFSFVFVFFCNLKNHFDILKIDCKWSRNGRPNESKWKDKFSFEWGLFCIWVRVKYLLQRCGWIKLLQTNQKRNILTGRSISYVCSITISICTIFCVFLIIFNLLCVFEIQFVLLQLVFRIICTWCHHISIQLLIVLIQSKLIFSMLASHWLIDVL